MSYRETVPVKFLVRLVKNTYYAPNSTLNRLKLVKMNIKDS